MIPHFRYNRTYDVPLNHEQCRQYISDIVELKRGNLSLVEKVERLTKFCDSAAFFCRPDFVQARGVHYLVELATAPGNDVDEVAEVSEETHHSMRRVAVGALAEQANYWPYVQEMKAAGLFQRLPRMLDTLGPYYRHGQSYQHVCGWGKYTDQRQFLYERLVGICAGAAMYDSELGAELLEACGELIFQQFHATASAAVPLTVESYLDCDPLPDTLLRFLALALPGASDAVAERLLSAGADQKLRACRVANEVQRQAVLQRLDDVYERRQARVKAQAEARSAADQSSSSAKLRHAGNKAFQRGRVEEAARLYSEALVLDPNDPVVHSNRSLCHLRLKNHAEAARDALAALRCDVLRAKSWARAGDALGALGCRQLARLSYEQAQGLLPTSTEYKARAFEAAAALGAQQPWDAASIPDGGNPEGDAQALGAWLGCDAADARERLSLIRRGGDLQRGDERALAAAELRPLLDQVRKRRGIVTGSVELSNGHA